MGCLFNGGWGSVQKVLLFIIGCNQFLFIHYCISKGLSIFFNQDTCHKKMLSLYVLCERLKINLHEHAILYMVVYFYVCVCVPEICSAGLWKHIAACSIGAQVGFEVGIGGI